MAFHESIVARTYIASAAILQFVFVTQPDSNGRVATAGAAARVGGVAIAPQAAALGSVPVAYDGRVQVLAGGTFAAGALITPNAAGRAVLATTGNIVAGVALEAGVNNQVVTVELTRSERAAP